MLLRRAGTHSFVAWAPALQRTAPQVLRAALRPGHELINRRLLDRRAKAGLEEIEIAAFIGLFDVPREHPAIAAFEPRLRLLPFGAAFCELDFRHIEIDSA